MTDSTTVGDALEVVIPCVITHLNLLPYTLDGLEKYTRAKRIFVVARAEYRSAFESKLGGRVELLDADELTPGMTLAGLQNLRGFPYFPARAGWYLQQINKLAFGLLPSTDSHFLIWDADTVPLRPLSFFDELGRVWFTMSKEFHLDYFENYTRLLGHGADREFSFISEHMVVDRRILKEMFETIERRFPGEESWAWKIMRNLRGNHISLFSEYETYGHYVKAKHRQTAAYRFLPWHREVHEYADFEPSPEKLARLAETYSYATFEIYA
ncbi:MAG: hypothetical protein HY791_23170 [Deltaproteobacteria bacterium]|nr:hypothetical protein [Deltaproteobacteria bacterium]